MFYSLFEKILNYCNIIDKTTSRVAFNKGVRNFFRVENIIAFKGVGFLEAAKGDTFTYITLRYDLIHSHHYIMNLKKKTLKKLSYDKN